MIFENQIGQKVSNPTKEKIKELLLQLDGVGNSYAHLDLDSGDYIQVGGGPLEFTVEIRKYITPSKFKHWKATLKNSPDDGVRFILIAGNEVKVRSNQVLDFKTVAKLFEMYIGGESLPEIVLWSDMTEMFLE